MYIYVCSCTYAPIHGKGTTYVASTNPLVFPLLVACAVDTLWHSDLQCNICNLHTGIEFRTYIVQHIVYIYNVAYLMVLEHLLKVMYAHYTTHCVAHVWCVSLGVWGIEPSIWLFV